MASYVRILKYLQETSQIIFTSFRKEVLNIDYMNILNVDFADSSRVRTVNYDFADGVLLNQAENQMHGGYGDEI